jgi:hypothetical protein
MGAFFDFLIWFTGMVDCLSFIKPVGKDVLYATFGKGLSFPIPIALGIQIIS